MKLARQMGMSVRRAQQEIDVDEYLEHLADYSIEPWDDTRLEGVIANGFLQLAEILHRAWFKGGRSFKFDDFLIKWDKPKQTSAQMSEVLMQAALAARDARNM